LTRETKTDKLGDMNSIKYLIDLFLHIDKNLALVIARFGIWSYGLMFFVLFMETGFVVTPFLPGDSLLFAAGALTASVGAFNIWYLWGLMVIAAFLGDTANYWIGRFIGPKAFSMNSKLFKKEYLDKAQTFYDKHGGVAILLARFVPIVRTFAPFVAGIGKMSYGRFISFNAIGGFLWVTLMTMAGYFFGNIPLVKNNFEIVVVLVILISVVPIGVEWLKSKRKV
jgi:membrane-associated protein